MLVNFCEHKGFKAGPIGFAKRADGQCVHYPNSDYVQEKADNLRKAVEDRLAILEANPEYRHQVCKSCNDTGITADKDICRAL